MHRRAGCRGHRCESGSGGQASSREPLKRSILLPRHKPHTHSVQAGDSSHQGEREHLLLTELIAARKQVDKLLDHQGALLSLLLATHPALNTGQSRQHSSAGPFPLAGLGPTASQQPALTWAPHSTAPAAAAEQLGPCPDPDSPWHPPSSHNGASTPTTSGSSSSRSDSGSVGGGLLPGGQGLVVGKGSGYPNGQAMTPRPPSPAPAAPSVGGDLATQIVHAAMWAVEHGDVLTQDLQLPPRAPPALVAPTPPAAAAAAAAPPAAPPAAAVPAAALAPGLPAAAGGRQETAGGRGPADVAAVEADLEQQLPCLVRGDCSIWWMERLHVALLARGFYSGDDDIQSATFGSGTQKALDKFQQQCGLPPTGFADPATWTALLSELPELRSDLQQAISSGEAPASVQGSRATRARAGADSRTKPAQAGAGAGTGQETSTSQQQPSSRGSGAVSAPAQASTAASSGGDTPAALPRHVAFFSRQEEPGGGSGPLALSGFNPSFSPFEGEQPLPLDPLDSYYNSSSDKDGLRRDGSTPPKNAVNGRPPQMQLGDVGGFFVETLHTALLRAGFDPSFRDVDNVEFGAATQDAVIRFQLSRQLLGSGEVEDTTWALLLQGQPELRTAFIKAVAATALASPAPTAAGADQPTNSVSHSRSVTTDAGAGAGAQGRDVTSQPAQPAASVEKQSTSNNGHVAHHEGGGTRQVQPPVLCEGDDDVAWVSLLHRALQLHGFHTSEEEEEAWLFLGGTAEAVMAAQAAGRLPETGVVDSATWQFLLQGPGSELSHAVAAALGGARASPPQAKPDSSSSSSSDGGSSSSSSSSSSSNGLSETDRSISGGEGAGSSAPGGSSSSDQPSSSTKAGVLPGAVFEKVGMASSSLNQPVDHPGRAAATWPVLMLDDGGKDVHLLQAALDAAGFACCEDEARWWMFGDSTLNSLKTFQACHGLAETGVCDESSWLKLMGDPAARPHQLDSFRSRLLGAMDDAGEDGDITGHRQGRVWLIGEQRWERQPRGSTS